VAGDHYRFNRGLEAVLVSTPLFGWAGVLPHRQVPG